MKPYVKILTSIDREFDQALQNLKADPLFSSDTTLYTEDDKARIAKIWKGVVRPFFRLRKIIRRLYWRSFLTFGSKNSFVVKYAAIVTYYNMVYELQQSFGRHEEFLRQYLDDTFSENYSTLARFMYHVRFYSVLSYPHEYFLTLRDEVDRSLSPLFDRESRAAGSIQKRWTHDLINIYYYFRYRLGLLLTWIAKHGGRLMMHIRVSRRTHGLITDENIEEFITLLRPGDILLTRQNWGATNLNIPGFWKHMAMYVGTGSYLKKQFPNKNTNSLDDNTHYIIEAIGIGIQIVPISLLCAHNDYIAALRPRFSLEKKNEAIQKTLSLIGREYDYSFNFYSDINYVCSTLVAKAYLPDTKDAEGLHISLTRIGLGITYPPNDLAKKYKDEYGTKSQELDFVGFIDSYEKTEDNFLASEEAFRESGFRPKLSFFLP